MKRIIIAVLIALLLTRSPAAMAENAARFPAYDEATGKWGYIDVNGQWAIAPQFEMAGIFRGSYAAVSTGDPWEYTMGVIDGSGSWVVEPRYFVDEGYDGWEYGGLDTGMYLVWNDSDLGDAHYFGYFDVPSGYLSARSTELKLTGEHGRFLPRRETIRKALNIGLPMGVEHVLICGAQILTTVIVAPLGVFAIAANSFAVTAEALCYMPGYGIQGAATTLVGQAYGARRKDLVRSFGWLTTLMGMAIMSLCGMAMYFLCPYVFAFLTPVKEVRELGVKVLRIELFAEPMFGASIVSAGALRGVGDTLIPAAMSLVSIWGVRVTLASFLAPRIGLEGAWIAMCIELTFRGIIFLIRLARQKDFRKNSSL